MLPLTYFLAYFGYRIKSCTANRCAVVSAGVLAKAITMSFSCPTLPQYKFSDPTNRCPIITASSDSCNCFPVNACTNSLSPTIPITYVNLSKLQNTGDFFIGSLGSTTCCLMKGDACFFIKSRLIPKTLTAQSICCLRYFNAAMNLSSSSPSRAT